MLDKKTGSLFCNQCFDSRNGDGIAAIQWLLNCDFPAAMEKIAGYLGISPTTNRKKKKPELPSRPDEHLKFQDWNDRLAGLFCLKKRPIKTSALQLLGAKLATYRNQFKVIAIPVFSQGQIVGWCLYNVTGGPLPTWTIGNPKPEPVKIKLAGGSKAGIIGHWPQGFTRAIKTEGPSDLLALLSLPDFPDGIAAFCNGSGAMERPDKFGPDLIHRLHSVPVDVVHDCDQPGQQGATYIEKRGTRRPGWCPWLYGFAGPIRNIVLPFPIEADHGKDLRDWLAEGNNFADLNSLAERLPDFQPHDKTSGLDSRTVVVGIDESRVADEVIPRLATLAGPGAVYQRGGALVGIVPIEDKELPAGLLRLVPLALPTIRERITVAVRLVKEIEREGVTEYVPVAPPKWLPEAIAARQHYPSIKLLAGVVQSPTLRRDGSILQSPGYDDATGLLYSPLAAFPPVSDSPSRVDVQNATGRLLDVISDFPFAHDSDRSAWLAMLLTMIGRPAIDGCCPLFAITANTRGTGKGLLVDAASIIAYGRKAAKESFCKDAEELRKRITSIAIEGRPFVLFDNVDIRLSGTALDSAITSGVWSDRVLGRNATTGEIPFRSVLSATGNNLYFDGDTARRTLIVRLDSELENPEDRKDFSHPELLPWVTSQRAELAAAALTILRGYFAAGCPSTAGSTWGSFEVWYRVIRGAVVWAGLADPMATRETARNQDSNAETLAALIKGLLKAGKGRGLTAGEICELITKDKGGNSALADVFGEICGDQINARTIGNNLKQFAGRVINGYRINFKVGRGRTRSWRAEKVCDRVTQTTLVTQLPSLHVSEDKQEITQSQDGQEFGMTYRRPTEIESPVSPESPSERACPSCRSAMNPIAAEPGWINWDCQGCRKVIPERVKQTLGMP